MGIRFHTLGGQLRVRPPAQEFSKIQFQRLSRDQCSHVSNKVCRPSMPLPGHWTLDAGRSTRASTEVRTTDLWASAFFSQHMIFPSRQWWINRDHSVSSCVFTSNFGCECTCNFGLELRCYFGLEPSVPLGLLQQPSGCVAFRHTPF